MALIKDRAFKFIYFLLLIFGTAFLDLSCPSHFIGGCCGTRTTGTGWHIDLVIHNGVIHTARYNYDKMSVEYAYKSITENTWHIETVEKFPIEGASRRGRIDYNRFLKIAVDDETVYIAYAGLEKTKVTDDIYDVDETSLKLARREEDSKWYVMTVTKPVIESSYGYYYPLIIEELEVRSGNVYIKVSGLIYIIKRESEYMKILTFGSGILNSESSDSELYIYVESATSKSVEVWRIYADKEDKEKIFSYPVSLFSSYMLYFSDNTIYLTTVEKREIQYNLKLIRFDLVEGNSKEIFNYLLAQDKPKEFHDGPFIGRPKLFRRSDGKIGVFLPYYFKVYVDGERKDEITMRYRYYYYDYRFVYGVEDDNGWMISEFPLGEIYKDSDIYYLGEDCREIPVILLERFPEDHSRTYFGIAILNDSKFDINWKEVKGEKIYSEIFDVSFPYIVLSFTLVDESEWGGEVRGTHMVYIFDGKTWRKEVVK
jgi:hypothetical protein